MIAEPQPGEMLQSGTFCFSIDGSYLANTARNFVTEGRWRDGLGLLTRGLEGISTDDAISILRGTHTLTGVNEVDLVEDGSEEAAEHIALVLWQNAGLWRRPGKGLWAPYASVISLDRRDIPEDRSFRLDPEKFGHQRILFYADDPAKDWETDEREILGRLGLGAVLWRKVPDPPLWLEGSDTSGAALTEFLQSHRLEERGPWDEGSDGIRRPELTAGRRDVDPLMDFEQIERDLGVEVSAADRLALTLGVEGKMAEAVHAIFDPPDDSKPEPDDQFCGTGGYILPDGRFFSCGYMKHRQLAARILRWYFDGFEAEDPQIEADRRNWLRIQPSVLGHTSFLSPKGRPTKAQERALANWCIAHEMPHPKDLE